MVKAVFIDYMGTLVQEDGKELREVIARVCKNSSLHDPKAVVALWWKLMNQFETDCYRESYLTEDEIVDEILGRLAEEIQLKDDLEELHGLMRAFWVHAPLFEEAEEFLTKCPVPVYVISNNGLVYLEASMREKNLSPAGIVCADMVRAYKPHKELFEKALEISGCRNTEVVHIGDSVGSDVQGALKAGIRPILVQRVGADAACKEVETVRSLLDIRF